MRPHVRVPFAREAQLSRRCPPLRLPLQQGLGVIPGAVSHFRSSMDAGAAEGQLTVPHIGTHHAKYASSPTCAHSYAVPTRTPACSYPPEQPYNPTHPRLHPHPQPRTNSLKPHMSGWNGIQRRTPTNDPESASYVLDGLGPETRVYFVHSFRVMETPANSDWVMTTTTYGSEYVSSVQKGDVVATQFHPEKSGAAGLKVLGNFLARHLGVDAPTPTTAPESKAAPTAGAAEEVTPCVPSVRMCVNVCAGARAWMPLARQNSQNSRPL